MAKRKKRYPKSKPKPYMMSRNTNVPRFLVMLAVGLVVLVLVIYAAATDSPVVPVDEQQQETPADSTIPEPPDTP